MTVIPDLIVYTKPGCGLCREALQTIDALLAARHADGHVVPAIVERDISSDPGWERSFFDRIPVVDLGDQRLELVTGAARLRRLLADVLDAEPEVRSPESASRGG